MDSDERIWRLAEAEVRLAELRMEIKAFADRVWLSMYGPDRGSAEQA